MSNFYLFCFRQLYIIRTAQVKLNLFFFFFNLYKYVFMGLGQKKVCVIQT